MIDESKKNTERRKSELIFISNMMRNQEGRDFMHRLLQHSRVFESIFNNDPHLHSYNSGLRASGLWLMGELKESAPDEYVKMIKENL